MHAETIPGDLDTVLVAIIQRFAWNAFDFDVRIKCHVSNLHVRSVLRCIQVSICFSSVIFIFIERGGQQPLVLTEISLLVVRMVVQNLSGAVHSQSAAL